MKRLLLLLLLVFPAFVAAQNVACYNEQGGAKRVAGSGCEFEFQSGATLDIQSGTTMTNAADQTVTGDIILSTGGLVDINGIADGLVIDADGDTTISSPTDDQIDIEVSGADDFTITANDLSVLSGSKVDVESGATLEVDTGSTFTVGTTLELGTGGLVDVNGIADGLVIDADGDTTISSPTDDQIDIEVSGADDFTITANDLSVLSGSKVDVESGATLEVDSGATFTVAGTSAVVPLSYAGRATFKVCGDATTVNNNTIYYGPSLVLTSSATAGSVVCDTTAVGNITEATADAPAFTAKAFVVLGMSCYQPDSGNTITYTARSAEAGLTPALVVSIADNELQGMTSAPSTVAIASGATFAVAVASSGDIGTIPFMCEVDVAY